MTVKEAVKFFKIISVMVILPILLLVKAAVGTAAAMPV